MAIDTKPNLSNKKFEQCSDDIMNLSGCTQIYGYFDIESGATLTICGGAGTGKVLTSDATGIATWQTSASGAGSGENITKEISQSSHGFGVQDFVGFSGGTYNLAIADGSYDGEFIGLVSCVPDVNTFCVTQAGYVSGLTGLITDTTYFLSETTAGLITATEPSGDGEISKAVIIANSTTSGWVLPYVGYVISTGSTTLSSAANGLTDNGGIVELGGNLIRNTVINTSTYDLCIANLPAQSTETKVMYVDADGKLSCGIAAGSPSTINSGTTNATAGTTHTHCLDASTFVTGEQGILVDVNNRFYLDNSYIADATLPSLYTYTGITGNSNIGSLPSGQTLGMVYITNSGSSTASVNLGTSPSGNDITQFQPIEVAPDEDVSVTVNMRLSQTETKDIYINSSDWTGVELKVQWANITYQNAETTIDPGDLPIATQSSLGAIRVGDGLDIDNDGILSVTGGSGAGTITGATNLGTGNGTIFTSVSGEDIQLKSLSAGTDITITSNGEYITINSSSAGTITGGTNGLGESGADVCLGGTLSNNTEFDGTASNYHLCYASNYSSAFGARSIPDVAYVTGLTSGGSGGFLGTVSQASIEPQDLQENQWVKPAPTTSGDFNYVFTNFSDSGGTAISVNLSLEDVYLRYCATGSSSGYWIKESYNRPLSSGYTWMGNSSNSVCEIPVIDEWVSTEAELQYAGQKFAYPTQTVFQIDIGCCVTMPNKIFIENIELCTVGDNCIYSIPVGKTTLINSAKLIMKQTSNPDSFTVSIGNNCCTTPSLSFNNMVSNCQIDDVLNGEVYELLTPSVPTNAVSCTGTCLLEEVKIRVQSAASNILCANLLLEGYVY